MHDSCQEYLGSHAFCKQYYTLVQRMIGVKSIWVAMLSVSTMHDRCQEYLGSHAFCKQYYSLVQSMIGVKSIWVAMLSVNNTTH